MSIMTNIYCHEMSASQAKRRFSFLRPPILSTTVHPSCTRSALITLSVVTAKTFGSHLMPTACMYCTSTRFTQHRVTRLSPSQALRLEQKPFQRVLLAASNILSAASRLLVCCSAIRWTCQVHRKSTTKSPNTILSVRIENKVKSPAVWLKSRLQPRLIASSTDFLCALECCKS